jgi:MFS family permease
LSDVLSGLYNAGFSLGIIVGPMAGSYITIGYNSFGICTDVFAFTTILFCGLLLFFVVRLFQR